MSRFASRRGAEPPLGDPLVFRAVNPAYALASVFGVLAVAVYDARAGLAAVVAAVGLLFVFARRSTQVRADGLVVTDGRQSVAVPWERITGIEAGSTAHATIDNGRTLPLYGVVGRRAEQVQRRYDAERA